MEQPAEVNVPASSLQARLGDQGIQSICHGGDADVGAAKDVDERFCTDVGPNRSYIRATVNESRNVLCSLDIHIRDRDQGHSGRSGEIPNDDPPHGSRSADDDGVHDSVASHGPDGLARAPWENSTNGSRRSLRRGSLDIDVRLDQVTKRFGDVVAVDDLSLEIGRGEFFSLLGPSGCGKTTTLRMIGGFEDPTEGAVYLRGNDVTELPPYRRNVNTVFQSYALFPHLNVFENVAFGLRRKKTEGEEIARRVKETLRLVDLEGFDKRKPSQLSGGQQQRVALARALVNQPDVLLLDEPLGALDLKLRKQMQLELKRIQQEVGITFLYVTHDQEEAMTMSNRLAVMRHGKIEQLGPPHEIYENPATEFVAGFLGASNLLDGELKDHRGDEATILLSGGTAITIPTSRLNGLRGRFKVGVRPEKIFVLRSKEKIPEGWNSVHGQIRDAAYVGVSHQFTVEGVSGRTLNVYEQNIAGRSVPRPGDSVRLVWKPKHTFVVRPSAPTEEEEEKWKNEEIA